MASNGPSFPKLGETSGRLYEIAHPGLTDEQKAVAARDAAKDSVQKRPHTFEQGEAFVAGWITGYDTMEKGSKYLMETAAITREEFEKLLGVIWGISEGQYNTKWELVDERLIGEGTLESPILLQWAQDWAER